MAIALAEADKYEILEKIGMLKLALKPCVCSMILTISYYRMRFLRDHSQGEAKDRWIRECLSSNR
ncbi:hypothetical protein VI817_001585 [Penicillium citrinum]|nr:hypothetical protein VI817_001585 [Penicillium citrinum]